MSGGLDGRGREPSARKRVDALAERIGHLRLEGIAAQMALQARQDDIEVAPEAERPRLLGQLLRDERAVLAAGPVRQRAEALWQEVVALRAKAAPHAGEMSALEAEVEAFESQIDPLRAWFQIRAAVAVGGVPARLSELLTRSLAVDRDLLPSPELVARGRLLLEVDEPRKALQDIETARLRPDADVPVTVYAAALTSAHRPVEAANAYRQAFDAGAGHDPALLVAMGRAILVSGRHREALGVAQTALSADPSSVEALHLRADALRFLTRLEEAEEAYRGLAERPDPPDVQLGLLAVLVGVGRTEEAARLLEAIRNDPESSPVRLALASHFAHRYLEAAALSLRALADPGLSRPIRKRLERLQASFDISIGCPDAALESLERQLAADPDDADLEDDRATALSDLGRFDEAISSCRRAKALIDRTEFDSTLARVLRWSNDAAEALPPARRSYEARPRRTEGLAELLCCLLQSGSVEEARSIAEHIPSGQTDDPYVLYGRAALAQADGDTDEARRLLGLAAAIRPEFQLRATIDPLFHDGASLDEGRRAGLGPLIEINDARRAALAESGPPPLQYGDRLIIRTLARAGDLTAPKRVAHWIYMNDRQSAEEAAAALRAGGFEVSVEGSGDSDERWCVKAVHRIVVSPGTIAATRVVMESLTRRLRGTYDDWEVEADRTAPRPVPAQRTTSKSDTPRELVLRPIRDCSEALGGRDVVSTGVGPNGRLIVLAGQSTPGDPFPPELAAHVPGGRYPPTTVMTAAIVAEASGSVRAIAVEPRRLRFPIAQPLSDGGFLVAEPRVGSEDPPNGRVYDANGNLHREIMFGDGIEHLLVDELGRAWVAYFDEGIFGNREWGRPGGPPPIGAPGLNRFDLASGALDWSYDPPSHRRSIAHCFALNLDARAVWVYFDNPRNVLARIEDAVAISFWDSSTNGAHAVAVAGDRALLAGRHNAPAAATLWRLGENMLVDPVEVTLSLEGGRPIPRELCGRGAMLYAFDGARCFAADIAELLRRS